MADSRVSTTTTTEADVAAWAAVCDLSRRLGPDRSGQAAVYASGHPVWPYVLLAAARNTAVDDVIRMLRLMPGELTDIVGGGLPAPAAPLPPGEETVIPDDLPAPDSTEYGARQRLVLLGGVPEPVAASLAIMAPGARGIALYCAARGDSLTDAAELLGITPGEIDAVLAEGDGRHLTRPPE